MLPATIVSQPPASLSDIEQIEEFLEVQLPPDYRRFLMCSDGGEGPIGSSNYIALWSAGEVVSLNEKYRVRLYLPGVLLIGSDGGGDAYGFDFFTEGCPVISVPFVGMQREDMAVVAPTFTEFLRTMDSYPAGMTTSAARDD